MKSSGFSRSWLAPLALLLVASWLGPPAASATVESFRVQVDVAADGSLVERQQLTVRLSDAAALDRWRIYAVALDTHRQLISADAWRIDASGKKRKLSRRERDEAEYSGEGITYSSQRFLLFEPDVLEIGGRLIFDVRVAVDPYFPAGLIPVQPVGDTVESLEIRVHSAAGPLRYRLSGFETTFSDDSPTAELSESGTSLTLRGSLAELEDPPALAAADPRLLRFAWGPAQDWPAVARWYSDIESTVEHGGSSLDALAEEVLAAGPDPKSRLKKAVDVARRQIRYVAVEVGIGGYRPSPAAETASRGWGDCKDKSLLLIELLRRAGFTAEPALIRLDRSRRIAVDFPSPYDFNHLIVAVDVSGLRPEDGGALDLGSGAPVAAGWLFIDPTQTTGSAAYLHRGVQDQQALVVTGGEDGGELVRLPTLPESEMVDLMAEVRPGPDAIDVTVNLRFLGETASSLTRSLEATNPTDLESAIRQALLRYFPGASIAELVWDGRREGLPTFEVSASLRLADASLEQLRLPTPDLFPALQDLDAVEGLTAALSPAAMRYRTRLHLPEGLCPPRDRRRSAVTEAGHFKQEISTAAGVVSVDYDAVLFRAWHPPDTLEALRELAVAEHRASRRRLRFRCDG
ncbi:MAG: DUF3857 domain-containing protein [Acidobacteriota bacterium]